MISIAITVCNEYKELETLLDYLQERALSPDYEIIIQIDKDNYTDDVIGVIINRGIKHHFFPLNKDFAAYKNELIKHCSGEYIFQIDADEIPSVDLLNMLPSILESNPDVDVYLVPRINTVSGITEEHILKWRWKYENERINFPDYQWRIYKNTSSIKWVNKVHERLAGFKTYTTLPAQDEFCLLHPKTIERQEKQNNFYNTL
jgi:glycosyltransferase involved in cell wall biosynthesis